MRRDYLFLYLFAAVLAFVAAGLAAFRWLGRGNGGWDELVFPLILGSFMMSMWFNQRSKVPPNG